MKFPSFSSQCHWRFGQEQFHSGEVSRRQRKIEERVEGENIEIKECRQLFPEAKLEWGVGVGRGVFVRMTEQVKVVSERG